jgi:hypothetical protein
MLVHAPPSIETGIGSLWVLLGSMVIRSVVNCNVKPPSALDVMKGRLVLPIAFIIII